MNSLMYNEDDSPVTRELYAFRKLYNAALFSEWYVQGKYQVHKSKKNYDGDSCFGGDMFIVAAMLPTGLISQHYYIEDWDLFKILEVEKALFEYDGHTSNMVLIRMERLLRCRK